MFKFTCWLISTVEPALPEPARRSEERIPKTVEFRYYLVAMKSSEKLLRGIGGSGGILAFCLACGSTGCAQSASPDWPQFRGPGGQGVYADKPLPVTWSQNENVLWKTALPGAGTSSPIVSGDRIFLTSYTGYNVPRQPAGSPEQLTRHLLCLNTADGRMVWQKAVPAKLPEQAKIREEHGYASNTPVTDGQQVYAFLGKSGVFAFDFQGNQIWQADVGSDLSGWGSAASPVLHEDLVIVNASVESQSLIALDRKTGREKWRAGGIKESWNTPILVKAPGGKTELVVAIFGQVLGFDPATGEQMWSCKTDIGWYMVPSLVAHEGVIYCIGGRTGGGLAVKAGGRGDVTGSHRLWKAVKGSNVSSPIYHAGHLYWMHENLGVAYCAEAGTGNIVYEERLPNAGQAYASPILADGKLYYFTRFGRAFVLAAEPVFKQLAANELKDGGRFNACPAAADGRLYARSDGFLYCLGQRPQEIRE